MNFDRRHVATLLAAGVFALGATASIAQTAYPDKPVIIVVPYPAGGPTDVAARVLANELTKVVGQPVLVENRAGASGIVGSRSVSRSDPDGYTLLIGSVTSHGIQSAIKPDVTPYDPVTDFTGISRLFVTQQMMIVRGDSEIETVADLIDDAKADPGALNMAVSVGSTGHMAAEFFKRASEIEFEFIPYPGTGPSLNALLGGEVDMSIGSVAGIAGRLTSGELRGIAVFDQRRAVAFPDVPTIAEAGYSDAALDTWFGLFGPPGMDGEIIAKIHESVEAVLTNEEVKGTLLKLGVEASPSSREEFQDLVRSSTDRLIQLVKETNIKVE